MSVTSFLVARKPIPAAEPWGEVRELHAIWNDNDLEISMLFIKRLECRRIILSKVMQEIKDNVAQIQGYTLVGKLDAKMLKAPVGQATLFDRAILQNADKIPPGHYRLTVAPSCEPVNDPGHLIPAPIAQAIVQVEPARPRAGKRRR